VTVEAAQGRAQWWDLVEMGNFLIWKQTTCVSKVSSMGIPITNFVDVVVYDLLTGCS
jgi:hypothetical protein